MNPTLPPPPEDDIAPLFVKIVLGTILALFVFGNLPWHLDNLDQAKQAFVSYEMVEEGNWLYQHTPSGRFATKPPLAGWISTAIYGVTGAGWWDGAWRIPSLVAGILTLGLLWRAGFALFGNNIGGLLAIGAFGLNSFTPRVATLVRTDMLLTFTAFLLGCVLLEKVRFREPWDRREKWLACALIFAAMMVKGPIIYIFFFPGLVLFFVLTRIWKLDWPNYAWSGWWPWLLPLVLFGGWVAGGVAMEGEAFWKEVGVDEFLRRFEAGEGAKHNTGWFGTYTLYLLGRWLPWSVLAVGFLAVKEVRRAMRVDPTLLWVACWAIGGLLAMECVPSKRFDRILPIIPAFCILIPAMARHLPDYEWRNQPVGRLAVLVALLASLGAVGYTAHRVVTGYRDELGALSEFGKKVHFVTQYEPHKLAIVGGGDEGLLIYAKRPRFTRMKDALELWNAGTIDWLVLPSGASEGKEGLFEKHERELMPFAPMLQAKKTPETSHGYVLLKRVDVPRRRTTPEVTEIPMPQPAPPPPPARVENATPAPAGNAALIQPPTQPAPVATPAPVPLPIAPPPPARATPLPVPAITPAPITPRPVTPEPVSRELRMPSVTPLPASTPATRAAPARATPRQSATPARRTATPIPVRAAEPVPRAIRAETPAPVRKAVTPRPRPRR